MSQHHATHDAQRAALHEAAEAFDEARRLSHTGRALRQWVARQRGLALEDLDAMGMGVIPFHEECVRAGAPVGPRRWLINRLTYGLEGDALAEKLETVAGAGLIAKLAKPPTGAGDMRQQYRDHPFAIADGESAQPVFYAGGYVTAPVLVDGAAEPELIGFVYRSMRNTNQIGHKYRHSRTTSNDLGNVHGTPMGLAGNRHALQSSRHAILTEGGIFDYARLLAARRADPSLGLPITLNGLGGDGLGAMLRGHCDTVTLALDGDEAGIRRAMALTCELLDHGIQDVRVLAPKTALGDHHRRQPNDVNEIVKFGTVDALAQALKHAPPAPLGLIAALRSNLFAPGAERSIPMRRRLGAVTAIARPRGEDHQPRLTTVLRAWPNQEDAARWNRAAEGALMLPDGTLGRLLDPMTPSASGPRAAATSHRHASMP